MKAARKLREQVEKDKSWPLGWEIHHKWEKENPEKLRECQKKYESSAKGKKARKRVWKKRY